MRPLLVAAMAVALWASPAAAKAPLERKAPDVGRAVVARKAELRLCWDRARAPNWRKVEGKFAYVLTVSPEGSVTRVERVTSITDSESFARCIDRQMAKLALDRGKHKRYVLVRVSFRISDERPK